MPLIVSKMPFVDEIVIARMDTRNEPFAIGVIVAEPTLRDASCPPKRTHTLTLQRNESVGGASRAAAAESAPSVPARGLTASQAEELPLAVSMKLSPESYDVLVQWYDLQSDWVTKLRLLDDEHWNAEYAKHTRADDIVVSRTGQRPPSEDWIVRQYKRAVFLPKPGKAEEVQDTLAVASLIAWGARDALLTAAGQLTKAAYKAVWFDLVTAPPKKCNGTKVIAGFGSSSSGSSSSSSSSDDDQSSDDGDSSVTLDGGSTTVAQLSRKRQKKQDPPKSKRRRTNAVARAAPLSAPAAATQPGARSRRSAETNNAATSALAAAASPAAAAAATTTDTAAAASASTASVTAASAATRRCASCQELQQQVLVLSRDFGEVWRLIGNISQRIHQVALSIIRHDVELANQP
jgi:hypothetical protein